MASPATTSVSTPISVVYRSRGSLLLVGATEQVLAALPLLPAVLKTLAVVSDGGVALETLRRVQAVPGTLIQLDRAPRLLPGQCRGRRRTAGPRATQPQRRRPVRPGARPLPGPAPEPRGPAARLHPHPRDHQRVGRKAGGPGAAHRHRQQTPLLHLRRGPLRPRPPGRPGLPPLPRRLPGPGHRHGQGRHRHRPLPVSRLRQLHLDLPHRGGALRPAQAAYQSGADRYGTGSPAHSPGGDGPGPGHPGRRVPCLAFPTVPRRSRSPPWARWVWNCGSPPWPWAPPGS